MYFNLTVSTVVDCRFGVNWIGTTVFCPCVDDCRQQTVKHVDFQSPFRKLYETTAIDRFQNNVCFWFFSAFQRHSDYVRSRIARNERSKSATKSPVPLRVIHGRISYKIRRRGMYVPNRKRSLSVTSDSAVMPQWRHKWSELKILKVTSFISTDVCKTAGSEILCSPAFPRVQPPNWSSGNLRAGWAFYGRRRWGENPVNGNADRSGSLIGGRVKTK